MIDLFELVGYTGSVLVALSLTMKNIRKLRIINLIGASAFALYGFLINAYPVLALNAFIAFVDIIYLFQMYSKKDYFSLVPVLDNTHKYLNKFLDFYKNDIEKFFPEFDISKLDNPKSFFILRDLRPVGLFMYEGISNETVKIVLDYAIPDYRDYKNAKYIYYAESKLLKEVGCNTLVTESSIKAHQKYLLKIGFKPENEDKTIFRKKID
jgi:hypothetical protein